LRAHAVLCPSRTTADLVRALSPLAAHKVHVCAWGVDAVFGAAPQPDDDVVLERLALSDRPFVLAPGAVREKKNLPAVLRGMEQAMRTCRLVVTGPLTAHLVAAVARASAVDVRMTGEIDDHALAVLLRRASAVAVLSASEGFGLPVIEAQASGTPVIVSAGSTQARIADGAALVVDAEDEYAFAGALERATNERALLAASGLANAARFTWDRCAERVERIWEAFA
jgi:glycosyltransferase involved in cell wall biosynthesis